jgi:predicted DsbA family dithiol-disulfide isomerase
MKKLRVDVWSDIVCPWCYVGKRRLEAALARFAHRDAVEVIWRAFELDPKAPAATEPQMPHAERLARKYGMTVQQAAARTRQLVELAAADGLDFQFDRTRPGNTFHAHRLLHLAAEKGVQDQAKERLLRAYMTEGEAIGDIEVLERLAPEAGLDREEARRVLTSDAYAADVREEEEAAQQIGITGVPFFVIGERYAVSGAQPAEILLRALTQAWNDDAAKSPTGEIEPQDVADNAGAMCGPDGCD